MRALVHPALDAVTAEGILYALADPVRAHIFAEIAVAQCAQTCKSFLEVSDRRVPKSTLSKHFRMLREAGLIHSTRVGKEMHNVLREDVVKERFDTLVTAIINAHREQDVRRRMRDKRAIHRSATSKSGALHEGSRTLVRRMSAKTPGQ